MSLGFINSSYGYRPLMGVGVSSWLVLKLAHRRAGASLYGR